MFVGLTGIYGYSVRPALPYPGYRATHRHRPSAPQLSQFPGFVGAGLALALFAMGGRIVFRLRLSRAPRSEGQPILLGLTGTPGLTR